MLSKFLGATDSREVGRLILIRLFSSANSLFTRLMSPRSSKYGIKDKLSKRWVAEVEIRTQRRKERELEEGRAAFVELEKRTAEAQAVGRWGNRKAAPESERMRKLVLDWTEERKKVSRCARTSWRRDS